MNKLRRIFFTAAAAAAICGVASADTIIGYTVTTPAASTDITNITATLPSWDPGDTNTTTSNVSGTPFYSYTTGVSMASLDAVGVTYTLVGYNITVQETLTGNYTVTNTSTSSSANGSVDVDTYTAVGLNQSLGTVSNTIDPSQDIFNCANTGVGKGCAAQGQQATSTGGGPDPNSPVTGSFNLGSGQSYTSPAINVSSGQVDYGCEINEYLSSTPSFCTSIPSDGSGYGVFNSKGKNDALTSGLSAVETADPLTFYFSTATQTAQFVSGGNLTSAYNTSVSEQVTVTYDYTTSAASSTPEPTTMVLFGTALVGLGLLRKRVRRQQ